MGPAAAMHKREANAKFIVFIIPLKLNLNWLGGLVVFNSQGKDEDAAFVAAGALQHTSSPSQAQPLLNRVTVMMFFNMSTCLHTCVHLLVSIPRTALYATRPLFLYQHTDMYMYMYICKCLHGDATSTTA
eukprot:gene3133-5885_t